MDCIRSLASCVLPLLLVALPGSSVAPPAAHVQDVRIAPDGVRIVYLTDPEGDGSLALCTRSRIGGPETRLDAGDAAVRDFALAPDGAHVLYRAAPGGLELGLFAVAADGSSPPLAIVAPNGRGEVRRGYTSAPDGRTLVFSSLHADGERARLYRATLDDPTPRALASPHAPLDFRMSADGQRVVYRARQAENAGQALYTLPLDGGEGPVQLADPAAPAADVRAYALSEDGAWVAFTSERGQGSSALWCALTDASAAPRELAPDDGSGVTGGFAFDPGSRWVVYRADPAGEGRFGLFAAAVDGRGPAVMLCAPLGPGERIPRFDFDAAGRVRYGLARSGEREPSSVWVSALDEDPAAPAPCPADEAADFRSRDPRDEGGGRETLLGNVGFRDFSYGDAGSSTPTGEKPESKLWWNDGIWWGDLFDPVSQTHHIFGLDRVNQRWVDTGVQLDDRASSKADVLWDEGSQKLYVASHLFTTNAQPTSSNWGQLLRYSYSPAAHTYSLDPGFPVDITRGNAEALTIAKDSQGRLWATWVEAQRVLVNHSLGSDTEWGTPAPLPATGVATAVSADDISAILAFGGDRVGVMWSNQLTTRTYFAVHRDLDGPGTWQPEEIVLPDNNCSTLCSDDLFSLKADSAGRVYAAAKTSQEGSDQVLNVVTVRDGPGSWHSAVFGLVHDHHTRPILLLDEEHQQVHVFATHPEEGGAIYHKSSPTGALAFEPGLGTPFLLNATDVAINNATSTKQNVNSTTDVVVLASDQDTHFYLHNVLELGASEGPAVDSFAPAGGPVGTNVVVRGRGFTGASAVAFGGVSAVFQVLSDTRLGARVPVGAHTGPITVVTPAGNATSSQSFVVGQGPTITHFAPAAGPVGTAVLVEGTAFTGTTGVRFNGTSAAFQVFSDTRLGAAVPPGATSGPITVETPDGNATSSQSFTVGQGPSIASFTPPAGPVGRPVVIDGARFDGTTRVAFNGTSAEFQVLSSTRIGTRVPAGATSGRISVTTPAGSATSAQNFVVGRAPTITAFAPHRGEPGTQVLVEGTDFTGATAVAFHGRNAAFQVLSSTRLGALVPAGATTGRITVTTPVGTGTSSIDFVVVEAPVIASFSPQHGPVGTQVLIDGAHLESTTAVSFHGRNAPFQVLSSTRLATLVPAGATTGRIAVGNQAGVDVSSSDFVVESAPAITGFSPDRGPEGTVVAVAGQGLAGVGEVRLGSRSMSFHVEADTLLRFVVGPGSSSGRITLVAGGGSATSARDFVVTHPPVIDSFLPGAGLVGVPVTLQGSRFTGAQSVRFNGRPALTFTVLGDHTLLAIVPLGATSGPISVTTPQGTGVSAQSFTVIGL